MLCGCVQLYDGFPFFVEMQWYALDRYVSALMTCEHSPQAAVDQPQPRRYVSRKRLKTCNEAGGDCKSQRTPGDDDNADDENAGDDNKNDNADAQLPRYCAQFSCVESVSLLTVKYIPAYNDVYLNDMHADV